MEAAAERAFKSQCPCHRPHMNLYCAEWRAFGNFFHALSTLKEDKRQRLVPAYGAGRWASKTGCTPASPTRAYKECARRFVTFPIDEFRTSCIDHELGCTLQTLEMEKCQISPDDIKKCGVLTAQRMILRARFTNSFRALPLTAHTHTHSNVRIHRTRGPVPRHTRHRPVGQTPFLAYLASSSSSLSLLRSMVGEKRILIGFVELSDDGPPEPPISMSTHFPVNFSFLQSNTL